jgi:Tol biopolymer transport system component
MIQHRGLPEDELGRMVGKWLVSEAPRSAPPALAETVIGSVRRLRQRSGWLAKLRVDQPLGAGGVGLPTPRRALQLAVLALLLVMLGAALLINAGHAVHVPAPLSGPARNGLIAVDAGGQILVMNADGSGRMPITSDGAAHSSPTWSPDGTKLAFWSRSANDGPLSLTVVDADGTNARVVTGASLFIVPSSSSRNLLWPSPPDWAPDGTKLAFSATIDTTSRIVIATVDGAEPTVIGDPALAAQSPVWSPDSARIAFAGGRYPETALYVMNADGTGPHRLTTFVAAGGSFVDARWSPDGTRLVYSAGGYTLSRLIWVVNVNASGEHPFDNAAWIGDPKDTPNERTAEYPAWSPDGRQIAFIQINDSATRAGPQIIVMNADGSNALLLSHPNLDDVPIEWSPDGTRILAATADSTGFVLVSSRGSGPPIFLSAAGNASGVSWERLAP